MVLGQNRVVLVVTWWYRVSIGWYWWYLVILDQNRAVLVASVIRFQKIYGLHGLDHQIVQYLK